MTQRIRNVASEDHVAQTNVAAAVTAGCLGDGKVGDIVLQIVEADVVLVGDLTASLIVVDLQTALGAVDHTVPAFVGSGGVQGVAHHSALVVLDGNSHGIVNVDILGVDAVVLHVAVILLIGNVVALLELGGLVEEFTFTGMGAVGAAQTLGGNISEGRVLGTVLTQLCESGDLLRLLVDPPVDQVEVMGALTTKWNGSCFVSLRKESPKN